MRGRINFSTGTVEIALYRKKPVVIEAHQFTGPQGHPQWISDAMVAGRMWYQGGPAPYYTIETLEGPMRANVGDWIIKGVAGELYPCKPEVFDASYEPVARG